MSTRFTHALITGASSGLGRALALELVRRGARVHAVARRADALAALESETDGRVVALPCDVTDPHALTAAVMRAETAAPLDLVVAGAGVAENALDHLPRPARACAVFDLNVRAAAHTLELAEPSLVTRGTGTLAVISSLAGVRGFPGSAAYSSSKAAMHAWLEAKAAELHPTGVRVVDIRPGFVRTAMTSRNRFPMPFLMEPEEAARRMADGLERGRRVVHFPKRLAWPLGLAARSLPHRAWRRLVGPSNR